MLEELDNIMEDLIVGHNFDYARKALIEWHNKHSKPDAEKNKSICGCPMCEFHSEAYAISQKRAEHASA